jgi:hypothetical protein
MLIREYHGGRVYLVPAMPSVLGCILGPIPSSKPSTIFCMGTLSLINNCPFSYNFLYFRMRWLRLMYSAVELIDVGAVFV